MNDTPRTNMNRGYAATIKGINTTDYLVCDQNGPFVLAQCAEELERENILLREALRECLDGVAYTVSVDAILDPSTRHVGLEKLAYPFR